MSSPSLFGTFAALAVTLTLSSPALAQNIVGKGKTGPVPDPVALDITGMFQEKYASVGDDMFIGGQPTEKALRELKAKGVTTVVNLRMPQEMEQIGFDEAALIKQLGMKYVHIPMRGTPENPYGPKQLDQFAEAMNTADGKVLLHCTVAWRASHMWGAYLIRERKVPVAAAVEQARKINLRDDRPFNGVQPIEGFLGRTLPEIQHPAPVPAQR
ncbi:MAG: sulfur transferase domain-containing protein [Vicinamibacterales bacterium]